MHQPPVRFTYRLLSYLISTIIAGQPLLPAVGAVITPQNGAGMDKAANGVPVVNIATPNGAGISHNRFTDYNVGKEGLILNNATGKLNPTQLGGLIQNNPNLKAGGEAKGIINEVTGGKRSLLQGYTEVAGKAANVMVANPYGITCDGCGFINTPHATLTTGRPVMNADGSLQALEVTEGSITINGAGLDGTRSDAVSIIARATEVNAALHAKDLTVTAGANRVTADGRVSALKGEGDVPKVAVDTGALGGMYARRIHLTSTESGVGVNLGNLYAREGDIILSSSGKLVLKNSLAGGNTTVTGTDVSLSGDNKAGGNLSVTGTTGLTLNQSRLVTDKNLVLSSSGQIVQNGGELTAGQNAMLSAQHLNQTSGTVNAAENVTLTTTDDTTLKGRSVAGKTLTVSSGSLNNGGTLVAGRDATVKTGTFSNTGAVQGNGLKVTATDLTSTGSIKSGSTLDISVRNATLSGDAGAKDSARVTVSGTLENRGRLVSDDVLTLSATQINNSGTLSGAKELVASADTLTTTEKSVTNSDGNLMLNSASSTLAGETSAGGTVSVKGNSLKTTTTAQTQGNSVSVDVQNAQLDGTQAARDILTLNASEKLTHSGKSSAPSLSLSAPELTSSGVLVASALNTQSQTLTNSGLLQGEASLTVNTQRLDNQQNGTLYSAADLTLDIPDIRNSGLITGDNGLTLNTASLSNPGKITADTLNVRATTLDGDGLLQGAGALALAGDTLSQGRNGRWLTAGDLSLRGKTLNTAGTTQGQNITVQADRWANSGSVLATGNLTASATGQLTSTGDIMSQGDTTLNAATMDNRGSLLSAGTLSLDGNSLDNSGTVQGNHVTIRQNSVTNSGTLTGIAALTLAARMDMASPQPALMNNGGSLLTSGDLTITAGSITSSGHWQGKRVLITADSLANSGAIQAADSLTARLTGELVSTAGSKVTSNGEMALSALNLSNSGQWIAKNLTLKANSLTSAGDITGVDALTLTVNQTLNNHASGKLLSAGVLTLKADSVTNDGQLQGNATTITAGQLTNGGHLQGETLTLAASGGVNNRSGGVLMSRNALNVSTATLSNQGTIQGGGGVSLNATDRLQNDGKILSGSNLTLTAQVLANTGSGLVQAATLLLDVVNTVNGGRVLATGSADVKGTTLNNTGTLQGADLLVNYHTFSNSGTLLGTSGLGVKGSSLLQNGTGRLYSAGNLLLDAQDFSGQGQVVATGDVTLKLIAALTNHGTLAAGKTLSVTSQNAITNGGVMQGDAMVLGAGEAFTNNGTLTAGKGNSVFSAQRLFLNAPGSLQGGGDVSLNSRSDITISGFTGTAGSLTMNVAGTLLNSALIYAGNNLKLFTDRLHNQHGDILAGNSLWVQKDASGGANTEIINNSGNIETHQGDIVVRTGHLLNQREGFSATTTTRTNPSSIQGMGNALVDIPLDGSILWWESVTINGQTVMVPKLYLSPEDITLHNGSVISGNNVQLAGGNITNSGGSINAQNDLSLDSTGYIDNLNAGLISAGGSLDLSAIGDISNISSVISGKTVQLESVSGNISNITRRQQWNAGSDSRYGGVHLSGTDTGPVATIKGTDSLSLDAGKNIDMTGATVSSGGDLGMSAGNDINIAANLISGSKSQSGFWHTDDNSSSSTTSQGSSISAGGNLAMAAGHNLDVTASSVSAGHSALLSAGNDLSLNAVRESKNSRNGRSESHESHAAVSTVTAGDNFLLVAGRDIASQAAGMAAENNVVIRGGRDVNLVAESAGAGDSYTSKKKKEINETVRQQGTEIASGGDTTVTAGRDITVVASSVTATGNISVNAGRDVALTTATESDYHYLETKKKSGGFLSKKTTRTISEDSATREAGSLLSGNRVTVNAGDNLTVEGSDVVADRDVSLAAGNHVDVLAATSTDTSWRFKETKKSGLTGTGGIGFTIGSSKTSHDRREAGTTQSQSASTIGSTAGNVSITAGKQAHISGSDVIANRDISITGDSVVVDPGHDRRTVDEKFEQKKSGLTVALSGTVGSAINNAVTSAQETKESSDSRLKALQATKTALSGVQAGQAAAMATATGDPNAMGVSLSLTTQKSKSQQHSESDTVSGSTLNAGNNLSVVATGKNRGDNRGDIVIAGSQLKAGGNTSLDAANDILLSGAANTQKTTGRNSSSGGGVGVSIGAGGNGAGISVFAGVNAAKGSEKGNGTEWTETTTDSGKTVTINSGRDTVLNGAQVNGNRIIADVGHDLLISSQQDTSKYDSKQTSVAAGGSFTFGSMTGSGYIAASRDKMKSRFDSVAEQTGMFAGDGGFDITVGRHTQLDGAVIASTATPDKNHLDTGTLGFSDLHNEADYKVSHSGISLSGGGSFGDKFQGNMPGGMISAGGHSGHAEGTTQAAVAEGTITIRDRDNQKQNLANLSRDPAHANDSISPIFDKEKEQRRLQTVGLISDIGSQVADIARTEEQIAGEKAKRDPAALNQARAELEAAGKPFTEQDVAQRAYNNGMAASGFGTGGKYQQAIQAATSAVQGLAGANLSAALAGGAAPYLAEVVKTMTTDPVTGEVNKAANVAAHAVVNAALAVAQGNNALAGAAGAATGEVVGIIATQMYGKPVSELSETEKQTVSTLATVAAGLAGGLVGDSGASAVAGAQSGKTTVENNALSFGDGFESNAAAATSWNKYAVDNNLTPEQTQAGLDKIAKGDMPDSTNITKVIVDGYQDGVMIAGAWYLGPAASAGKVLGGGLLGLAANSGYQVYDLNQPQNANKSWDYLGSATSFTTGMMAPGRGVLANTGIAMGGAFFTDGPNTASLAGAGIGAGLGGAFGKYAPTAVGKILGNDPVPGFIYELGGGAVSEFTNGIIKDFNNPQAPEKKENK